MGSEQNIVEACSDLLERKSKVLITCCWIGATASLMARLPRKLRRRRPAPRSSRDAGGGYIEGQNVALE